MGIERVGQFIEFVGEDGLKTLVRVASVQILAETDQTGDETFLTVANKTFLVRTPLSELRDAITEDWRLSLFRTRP